MIKTSGAVTSAGSIEVLHAPEATFLGWLGVFLWWGSQGGSQHLGLVLALYAALGKVIFSLEWYALLASRASSHSSTA